MGLLCRVHNINEVWGDKGGVFGCGDDGLIPGCEERVYVGTGRFVASYHRLILLILQSKWNTWLQIIPRSSLLIKLDPSDQSEAL